MSDIELVIKIPEDVKNRLCFGVTYQEDIQTVCKALNNGTPLPKGHGDLIDRDELLKKPMDIANYPSNYVYIAQAIILADKESRDADSN